MFFPCQVEMVAIVAADQIHIPIRLAEGAVFGGVSRKLVEQQGERGCSGVVYAGVFA